MACMKLKKNPPGYRQSIRYVRALRAEFDLEAGFLRLSFGRVSY
jgi:hypothetical protein